MNSLIHADIFFFITSIAVIGISLAVLIILLYGIKIARTLSSVAESMKKQSDEIIEDIAELRQKVKSQGEKNTTNESPKRRYLLAL